MILWTTVLDSLICHVLTAFENTPNCIGYSMHVTVVYPVVFSEVTRRIINVVARPLIVCPFRFTIMCIYHLLFIL